MKKLLYFLFSALIILSCTKTNEVTSFDEKNALNETNFVHTDNTLKFEETLVNMAAVEKLQKNVITTLNLSLEGFDKNTKVVGTALVKNGEVFQLRTRYDNGYVTNTFVSSIENKNARIQNVQMFGLSCTKKACSHSTGCSVMGDHCSKCDGDCMKTTTTKEEG